MKTIIIDVRSEKEFLEDGLSGALNLSYSEFDIQKFEPFRNKHIALVCFSGNRAEKVKELLEIEGFKNVSLLQNQMVHVTENTNNQGSVWTIDRQFRLSLGILLGLGIVSQYWFNSNFSLALLLVLFSGLMYSSITDNCYLKSFISILPWNSRAKTFSESSEQIITT